MNFFLSRASIVRVQSLIKPIGGILMRYILIRCLFVACGGGSDGPIANQGEIADQTPEVDLQIEPGVVMEVSGSEGRYSFPVTVSSREIGCGQFADWWEVFNENSERALSPCVIAPPWQRTTF